MTQRTTWLPRSTRTRRAAAVTAAAFAAVTFTGCSGATTASPTATVTVTANTSPVPPIVENRGNTVGGSDQLPLLGKPQAYNAGDLIPRIQEYYNSGLWNNDVTAIVTRARDSINNWVQDSCTTTKNGKVTDCDPTVVFDIDDTLVTFFPYYNEVQTDWRYNQQTFRDFWMACKAPAIVPVRTLYNELISRGINVDLISGRDANLEDATLHCLSQQGFTAPTDMYLRQANQEQPAAELKAQYRAKIERSGQVIVANIGDQQADVTGGHQLKAFILPNPMYRLE